MTFLQFYREFILPYGLGVIMLGMGLSLTPADFARILFQPRAVVLGLSCQLVLFPAIAIALGFILPLSPLIAFSLILVSACPGGISSNAIVFAIRGNVALSVTLTAFSSSLALLTIPLIANIGLALHYGQEAQITLPLVPTLKSLFVVTILPITTGMAVLRFAPALAAVAVAVLRRASGWLLLFIVVVGTYAAVDFSAVSLVEMYVASQILAILGVLLGVVVSRFGGLDRSRQLTIAIEIGMQNVAMAMLIANNVLYRPDMAVVPGIYGVVMFLTVTPAILYFKRSDRRLARAPKG